MGYDLDPATRATARTAAAQAPANARWQVPGSIADAVRRPGGSGPDFVVVAVPLPAVGAVFDEVAATGYAGVVTDATSVKEPVRALAATRLRHGGQAMASFVGGHPMAGRETSGFGAADAHLFDGCAWVLCLEPEETSLADWLALAALYTGLGARVVPATAADHDRAVATVSHVPHLLAAALAAVLADLDQARAALDAPDPIVALLPWLRVGSTARAAWPPQAGESAELPARAEVLLRLGQVGGWVTGVAADRRTVTAVRPA